MCQKFHEYIWGNKNVTVELDHKPLEVILNKPLIEAPARLQRIMLQILPDNIKVVYKKAKELQVNTLNRDCELEEDIEHENTKLERTISR